MRVENIVITAVGAVAFILLMIGMFTPSVSQEDSGTVGGESYGGFTMPTQNYELKVTTDFWGLHQEINGDSSDTSWFDSEADDADGIGALRTAPILLVVGLVAFLTGTVLVATMQRHFAGTWVMLAGATVVLAAVITHVVGIGQLYGDQDPEWGAGIVLAWIGASLAILSGIGAPVVGVERIREGREGLRRGRRDPIPR